MNAQKSRNTYEESPEQLKELFKTVSEKKGSRLSHTARPSPDELVAVHVEQLKLLSQASVPIRSFVLPLSYPPSRVLIETGHDESCQWVRICSKCDIRNRLSIEQVFLNDLLVEERDPRAVILLKTVMAPYVYSATVTIVEDGDGNMARLTICNQEDTIVEPIFPEGTVVMVKQPCWSRLLEGGYHIRVDHPSDIFVLESHNKLVPDIWRKEEEIETTKVAKKWAKEGDMMFLKKRFRQALEWSVIHLVISRK